ncbi:MAG: hypothetical protein KC588_03425 [Nitrospira sp.]|nr:hypothetical protein [Nitrospira sp.]
MSATVIDRIRKVRKAARAADDTLFAEQNRLRTKELQLAALLRQGRPFAEQAAAVKRDIARLRETVARQRADLASLTDRLTTLVGGLVLEQTPQQLVAGLDDSLPCVLFPLRIETRFMAGANGRELWVRVYPDDITVHTHEKELTRDDADAGVEYWTTRSVAASVPDADERERIEQGAWRSFATAQGGTRAGWISSVIRSHADAMPGNPDVPFILRAGILGILKDPQTTSTAKRSAILAVLAEAHPFVDTIREPLTTLLQQDDAFSDETRQAILRLVDSAVLTYLGFDLEALKPESWSRAPRTGVLPDRFVLIGVTNGIRREFPFPNAVPDTLILGPNPQNLESELAQSSGDLAIGPDFAWIWDFEAAIEKGMALRVPLPEPFASAGFDRLMVLGMHVSGEPSDHKQMLEELIENHRYSPAGMGFVPQGTPTNHTADGQPGFSTDDAEGDASFALEMAGTPPPASDDLEKTDAQRLAEAWDVDYERLAVMANASQRDVVTAKTMNRALWPATIGYFLKELLETDASDNDRVRRFFTSDVVARGSLPAIRVGKQPYGVLVTSTFDRWQVNEKIDGEEAAFLRQVHNVLIKVQAQWHQLVGQVSHIDAPGDSFAHLLNILGLQATSVDYERRMGTYQTFLWNLAHLMIGGNFGDNNPMVRYFRDISSRGIQVINDLGFQFPRLPKLFGLLFSSTTSTLNGPLIDDIASVEEEKLDENAELPPKYSVAIGTGDSAEVQDRNYIGWLVGSTLDTLKQQKFVKADGTVLPVPAALLYRLLHRSLLLASYDATMNLYEELALVGATVRREQDFTNVEADRTVTRWEFMEARVNEVMPQIGNVNLAIGDFLATPAGLARPAAELLREVRESITDLEHLSTADLERLMAEHIDLCSYRLDAWQTAVFARRLAALNRMRTNSDSAARRGVHLGAYGWVENVRPAPPAVFVPQEQIPVDLREEGVTVVEQPNNGGYIHGPSINHAVAAAVLRNGYLTHADEQNADHFAVRLTSERVRTAVSFLEGVRNGQDLGALLGYQFERALHDRQVIDGQALAQFILAFRKKYPLVADRITPDATNESIDVKEAYQVVDGYALIEAVFLSNPVLAYPYDVEGLPADPQSPAGRAIVTEVENLGVTLDAIADLTLAEGVFQVTQGNYERAGATLKAMSEGNAPPEPEIINTPRGGSVVNHRIAIHFQTGSIVSPWGGPATPRSLAVPGLNKWLGERIGPPQSVQFTVTYDRDGDTRPVALSDLGLQPIDLIYLVSDEAGAMEGKRQVNDLTEFEVRLDRAYRVARKADDPGFDASGRTTILFMNREGFPPDVCSWFELLPLLRTLRRIVTTCRPLGAGDYQLPSEQTTDPALVGNVPGWDLQQLKDTLDVVGDMLQSSLIPLQTVLNDVPNGALNEDPAEVPDLDGVNYVGLIDALIGVAKFGVPGAFPKLPSAPEAASGSPESALSLLRARQSLIQQGFLVRDQAVARRQQAAALSEFSQLTDEERNRLTAEDKAGVFQQSAALLLGEAFRLTPTFAYRNGTELAAARAFSSGAQPDTGLLRFTQARLAATATGSTISDWRGLAVDEWLQGVASVRAPARLLDELHTYGSLYKREPAPLEPLQLPFDEKAHWIAVEYPEVPIEQLDNPNVFVPRGEFLSIVRELPEGHDAADPQAGLLVDEWSEVIPSRFETTGIAAHYDQPNTEPPQCVLVAVSPTIEGHWEWNNLVETLVDTLDRAKRRAVEPDFLRTTPYMQLLPTVLSTFTSFPFGTISTNLAAQPTSMVVNEGP